MKNIHFYEGNRFQRWFSQNVRYKQQQLYFTNVLIKWELNVQGSYCEGIVAETIKFNPCPWKLEVQFLESPLYFIGGQFEISLAYLIKLHC